MKRIIDKYLGWLKDSNRPKTYPLWIAGVCCDDGCLLDYG